MAKDEWDVELVLAGALPRGAARHDLTVRCRRQGAEWASPIQATADTFNGMAHTGRVTAAAQGSGWLLSLTVDVASDPWVAGGSFTAAVTIVDDGLAANGTWEGTFNGAAATGRVQLRREPRWHAPLEPLPGEPSVLRAWRQQPATARLGDFSWAGLGHAAQEPRATGREFPVTDFGAVPDGGRDATAAIQRAIDAAAAAGGGIVTFPPGRFELHLDDPQRCLEIGSDRIVLRGAGSGVAGTVLHSHAPGRSPDPAQLWRANERPRHVHIGPRPASALGGYGPPVGAVVARVSPASRGERELMIEPGSAVAPGVYLLEAVEDEAGTLAMALAPGVRVASEYRGAGRPLIRRLVTIEAVDGQRVRLGSPLRCDLRAAWTPVLRQVDLVQGVGLERLRLASSWRGLFVHHLNDEHDNGWDAVRCDGLVDGWVRDVVFDSCTTAVSLMGCTRCTVVDCAIVGNPAHNGFGNIASSSDNLFLRCHAGRQMHGFNIGGTPSGCVVVECTADEPSGIDLHGGIGTDNLFDACTGFVLQGGGSGAAVPPRHGTGLVLWNWITGTFDPFRPHRELSRTANGAEQPGFVAVGVRARDGRELVVAGPDGALQRGDGSWPWGVVEAANRPVLPRSLWRTQVAARLGAVPAWIDAPR